MYKYGTSYFKLEGDKRNPISGLDVRLVRPGMAWQIGLIMVEAESGSGYYETDDLGEDDCGLYEIWDNRYNPAGAFSGKTCLIGKLDALGLQKNAVTKDAILDESVSEKKLESGAISSKQLTPACVRLTNLSTEIQTESDGKGDISAHMPATLGTDKNAIHELSETYDSEPLVILIPMCDYLLYISQVTMRHDNVEITVGIGTKGSGSSLKYRLVAIRN
jgi:hypothetical protein